jgi:hypothetical protein
MPTLVTALNCCPVTSMHPERPFSSHKLIFFTNTTNWLQEIIKNTERYSAGQITVLVKV